MQPALEVSELAVRKGDTEILRGIDLQAQAGEVVALVGPNGAGKTTLMRALIGFERPNRGRIVAAGVDVAAAGRAELRRLRGSVGFMPQGLGLAGGLTAFHNALHGALGRQGPRAWWPVLAPSGERRLAAECLARVGVSDLAERRVSKLSGGQRQRVALARMLVQRPSVVLADEPVASLDPATGRSVMALLRELASEQGIAVLVSLHQLDYAREFADRIVGMACGTVVLDRRCGGLERSALEAIYEAVPA
jgi:phosphonate transport system ATP-binding protein